MSRSHPGYRDTSVILDDSCRFDFVLPSGSVAIKCTTRFYAARVCTLVVAGSDDSTGAGLGAMRFSTQPFKNLLQNSDLLLDASGWEGNHFVYHESLAGMVELPQIRDSLVYFGQMIPPESLEPWFGCPACLSLVGISEGLQPKAALELLYCLVKAETSVTGPDTIWQYLCGAALSTGYQSLV
jgi:hypothetical protein